jgi:hypothetical protein
MTEADISDILRKIDLCSEEDRRKIFSHLRKRYPIHDLEQKWNARAEIILEAIARSQDITHRGIRGVIAELCFFLYVVEDLKKTGWEDKTPGGDLPYDCLISDSAGEVKVQVKLQRQVKGSPLTSYQWRKSLPETWFVVETQKTRTGKDAAGEDTRPYRFGEFDILAVSMHPSTRDWNRFMYTVGNWLLPRKKNGGLINVLQPVSGEPNEDWTDNFLKAVEWLREGRKKTIHPGKL